MNTTNHTSPTGEDAANGAMGEREAFEAALAKISPHRENGYDLTLSGPNFSGENYADEDIQTQWEVWQARAALTAEKVAGQAEPTDFVFPPMPPAIVMHDKLGPLFDRLSMHFYAYKCMTIAAPQQPAQSAKQDERAAFLSGHDVEELFLRWSEWTTELGEAISRKNIDGFVSGLRALLAAQPVSGGKS
jgi:hypothetical protein